MRNLLSSIGKLNLVCALFIACEVYCLENSYMKPTATYNTSGYLNGIFSEDWIPMTQGEALNYYTAKEGYKLSLFLLVVF
jgi:hypothetical protein